ncbi:PilZ domain-containing protein [Maridesulfovibrio ferrireducens]|uniref:PilZ domain-containing protein n=1 Tax=Maridesulfovibrio ferrireducens TaxID=246191 RepID=UPI001A19E3D7|nr:PilZ domain-containing protein [Maridesulfovibrio ferrireducens]MBI9110400.1 PilZ domain-containing protein [Maridesulfovibrio ferrireducens]
MSAVRILLVCMQGQSREAYIKALDELNVEYDVVDNFGDTFKKFNKISYNGFLFDVATVVRAKAKDKAEANLFIERFPVLRVNYRASDEVIRGIPVGKFSGESKLLEDFVRKVCSVFPARSLRGSRTSSRVLNVLLRKEYSSGFISIEKSVTFDISEEGGFFFSVKKWEEGDPLSVVVKELADRTPILSIVRKVQVWGETDRLPGIEVRFLNLTEAQADQIEELM